MDFGIGNFGVPIMVSHHAMKDTDQRMFPASRHRSKRVHKKLVKRFGGEFRRIPCIYQTPQGLVAHPTLYEQLKRTIGRP